MMNEAPGSCNRLAMGLIFSSIQKNGRPNRGAFEKMPARHEAMCSTSVSAESSSHLPRNMYNLDAFDLCSRQQYPALQRDLSALSCEFRRTFQHQRNTATSWKQEL